MDNDDAESGTVLLDPQRDWAIRQYDVKAEVTWPGDNVTVEHRYHADIEYVSGEMGFFPKRIHYVTRTPEPEAFEDILLELDEVRLGQVDQGRFELTAYGLPEIPTAPEPSRPLFSWRNPVFWGCLIVAILAFTAQRILRRRSEMASN